VEFLTFSGLTNMDSYLRRTPTDQLSPNEQAQVLAHYSGSIAEFKTGKFHVCDMCRPHQIKDFFRRLNNMTDANAQEIQELAFNLGVTQDEYNTNAQTLDRIEMERYGRSPF
jgi:hypothetical protein